MVHVCEAMEERVRKHLLISSFLAYKFRIHLILVGEACGLAIIEFGSIGSCKTRNGLYCRIDLGIVPGGSSQGRQPDLG